MFYGVGWGQKKVHIRCIGRRSCQVGLEGSEAQGHPEHSSTTDSNPLPICNTCTFSVNAALLHGVASDCGVGHRSQLMWTLGQYLKSKGMETCMKGPGSVQNSFCFCSSSSGRPPSSFFLFQWELQWETAKNLFTAIKSSRNVLHPFSYHCLATFL